MLRPAMTQILKKGDNYYEFVVAIAQKARQITDDAEVERLALEEKPVKLAVELYANGSEKFVATQEMRN